jgi:hypothetical protein
MSGKGKMGGAGHESVMEFHFGVELKGEQF